MNPETLKSVLAKHTAWLRDEPDGEHANLRGADLRGADLSGADLSGADLSCADLSGADLRGADLSGADLSGADLSGADLSCADLSGADLRGAALRCADLSCADLSCADLNCADLRGAVGIVGLGSPDGWKAFAYVAADGVTRVRVGCRHFTLAEGRAYWQGKDDRREVMAALDYAEAIAKRRGWRV